jgi:uncharacterized protein RhaS with RHS repeats
LFLRAKTIYNYRRDYDPAVGRYVESDPIGLNGGSYSTYGYAGNDPLSNFDPLGLASCGPFDCPSIPDPLYNFLVGAADSASLGIGPLLRSEYGIGGPNRCSTAYKVGEYSSLALGVGRLAYAGAAKGLAALAANGAEAAATRNLLKQVFRGPFGGLDYRLYTYEQLLEQKGSDAAVQAAAGRTSPLLNAIGADAAAGAAINSSSCGCQ